MQGEEHWELGAKARERVTQEKPPVRKGDQGSLTGTTVFLKNK